MSGYTPLFSSIVMSSIWQEDSDTCKVWITMLALAGADGVVEGSVIGLANSARVSVEACQGALEKLSSPDLFSRTRDDEGRRIKEVDGGWSILNHKKYRDKAKSRAEYYRKWREKKQENPIDLKEQTQTKTQTQTAQQGATPAQHTRNGDLLRATYTLQQVKDACFCNGIPENNAQSYYDQYNSQDWKKANGQQITNLQSHMAKRWAKARQGWDFDESRFKKDTDSKKTTLFPISGKMCGVTGCGMPAVYKSVGDFDHFYCSAHMPAKVKERYI